MSTPTPLKRQDSQIRRALILEEAMRSISERGYFGFRIQDLAQRCGLTNGGLLYHFSSKEDVLLAVLDEHERQEKAAVRELIGVDSLRRAEPPPTLEVVKTVFRAIVSRGARRPEIVRLLHVLSAEALHDGHPAHRYFIEREARVISTFADLVRPYTCNAMSMGRRILALAGGLEMQWLRSSCGFDLAEEWDRAISAVFAEMQDHGQTGAST